LPGRDIRHARGRPIREISPHRRAYAADLDRHVGWPRLGWARRGRAGGRMSQKVAGIIEPVRFRVPPPAAAKGRRGPPGGHRPLSGCRRRAGRGPPDGRARRAARPRPHPRRRLRSRPRRTAAGTARPYARRPRAPDHRLRWVGAAARAAWGDIGRLAARYTAFPGTLGVPFSPSLVHLRQASRRSGHHRPVGRMTSPAIRPKVWPVDPRAHGADRPPSPGRPRQAPPPGRSHPRKARTPRARDVTLIPLNPLRA